MSDVLEAMCVECVRSFIAADIVDGEGMRVVWALVGYAATSDVDWGWRRAVTWVGPVVQGCADVVFRGSGLVDGCCHFAHRGSDVMVGSARNTSKE